MLKKLLLYVALAPNMDTVFSNLNENEGNRSSGWKTLQPKYSFQFCWFCDLIINVLHSNVK